MAERNKAYEGAVPHGIDGFFQSFYSAATILRISRSELDETVCIESGSNDEPLETFFQLLNQVELSLNKIKLLHAELKPFVVVVEGLDGSGKSTCVASLADDLGGVACKTPPASLDRIRNVFDKRGGPVARAFYMVGNYILQHEIIERCQGIQDPARRIFVVDRWYSSTCAYSIAWKNTRGAPEESIDTLPSSLFKWPDDLIPPQLQIVLSLDEETRRARVEARLAAGDVDENSHNPWDQRLSNDPLLGQRILRVHERSIGPAKKVIIDAALSKEVVVQNAFREASSQLRLHEEPWIVFAQNPVAWFQWQAHQSGAQKSIQATVSTTHIPCPHSMIVNLQDANNNGFFFLEKSFHPRESAHSPKMASLVCVIGDHPQQQQWRAEGFLVQSTCQEDEYIGLASPVELDPSNMNQSMEIPGSNEAKKDQHELQRPEDFDVEMGSTRLVPLRIEVFLQSNASFGPQKFEWKRDSEATSHDDNSCEHGWSTSCSVPSFIVPSTPCPRMVSIAPLTIVMMGTHNSGKRTIGQRIAQILGFSFQHELGDILRDASNLVADGHSCGDGTDTTEEKQFDDRIFQAECKRDNENSSQNRVVETWHVGNLAWALQRQQENAQDAWDDKSFAPYMEKTRVAVQQACQKSLVLFVFLEVDPETSVRRRNANPLEAARLPLSFPEQECQRLHGFLDFRARTLLTEVTNKTDSSPPILFVENHVDGEQGIQKTCRSILEFVQAHQWQRWMEPKEPPKPPSPPNRKI